MQVRNEDIATYNADNIIAQAIEILHSRLTSPSMDIMSSPSAVKQFVKLKLSLLEHEEFHVVFMDVKNRMLEYQSMFRGTLTCTSVYPREVVKAALKCNASSILLVHSHPSGSTEPSNADKVLTKALKDAMALIDVHVLYRRKKAPACGAQGEAGNVS